jgi:ATP phosphoribosyltransferase
MNSPTVITLGIPKGSLEAPTLAIFERVGLHFTGAARSLWLASNDPEIVPVLLKPQEIPTYVRSGRLDAGLSGLDWIVEQDVDQHVTLLAELQYSRQTSRPIKWVLAVPERSAVQTVDDLRAECEQRRADGSPFTISTELTRVSNLWLARHGIDAQTEFSWGATEAKAAYFSDAIIEGTETGTSLRANGLRVIAEVFRSTSQFFANKEAYRTEPWKRSKLDAVTHLIKGALRANELVQLTVVADRQLDLSAILGPDARVVTITEAVADRRFHAVVTIEKAFIPKALPAVISAGATDAWISPLNVFYSEGSELSGGDARSRGGMVPVDAQSANRPPAIPQRTDHVDESTWDPSVEDVGTPGQLVAVSGKSGTTESEGARP